MTREEAIEWLTDIKNITENWAQEEALDIAIEALQTNLVRCKDCKHYEPAHILHKDGTKTYVNENDEWVTADIGINVGGKCQNSGVKIHCIAHNCKEIVIFRNPMDHCSYGERKNDG